jgi:putative ABC transport system ATP-binding protein
MTPTVELRNVSHEYVRWGCNIKAIHDLSLSVSKGEWLMMVGPNGSGKSTILKLLAGDVDLQNGDILIDGRPASQLPKRMRRRFFSVMHQDPNAGTAATLTVGEHLLLAQVLRSSSNGAVSNRKSFYRSLISDFQLDVSLDQPAHTLSGGQRQLLTLLMVKLREARVLLLDEPFAALDAPKTKLCFEALQKLHAEGQTIVFVTHHLQEACRQGDRTVLIRDGHLVYDGSGASRFVSELEQVWMSADSVTK